MKRLLLALIALVSLTAAASASLSPRPAASPFGTNLPPARVSPSAPPAGEQSRNLGTRTSFVVTEQTEIVLNGKPCPYAQVPANARIVHMELAADNQTVLRIIFRTGR
jgi:hypothetical protein